MNLDKLKEFRGKYRSKDALSDELAFQLAIHSMGRQRLDFPSLYSFHPIF
jgi:hypothetical protein